MQDPLPAEPQLLHAPDVYFRHSHEPSVPVKVNAEAAVMSVIVAASDVCVPALSASPVGLVPKLNAAG
jgi:hypothetical protein